ncbi:hypothetical protein [Calothrix sp. CCY 0018]|uniref:hypothetical protein n=1 Tax=Calothrix sp. CCY 0018 TaxID=3103864 RepID=UPI0039C6DE36
MGCFTVRVSITYRQKGRTGSGTTIARTSGCRASPFSIGLDRSQDAFYLYYNGGKEKLEGNWRNYDLLASSIVSQTPCEGCVDPNIYYDCINGACVKKDKYGTPGIYQTIEECEVVCGEGCSGKCIANADWAKIQDFASKLKTKNCN